MQFLLLMHGDPDGPAPDGTALRPPADATTLRGWGDALDVEAGPLLVLDEPILGVRMIEAVDLAAAVEVAAGDAFAASGSVEVREIWSDFAPGEVPA